jgi:hypothetical protein
MAKKEGLPIAVATLGGLVSALTILLHGMVHGGRAWIVLIRAATAFLLSSAILKILTAGVIQGVRMKRTPDPKPEPDADETLETAELIASVSPEPTE